MRREGEEGGGEEGGGEEGGGEEGGSGGVWREGILWRLER